MKKINSAVFNTELPGERFTGFHDLYIFCKRLRMKQGDVLIYDLSVNNLNSAIGLCLELCAGNQFFRRNVAKHAAWNLLCELVIAYPVGIFRSDSDFHAVVGLFAGQGIFQPVNDVLCAVQVNERVAGAEGVCACAVTAVGCCESANCQAANEESGHIFCRGDRGGRVARLRISCRSSRVRPDRAFHRGF